VVLREGIFADLHSATFASSASAAHAACELRHRLASLSADAEQASAVDAASAVYELCVSLGVEVARGTAASDAAVLEEEVARHGESNLGVATNFADTVAAGLRAMSLAHREEATARSVACCTSTTAPPRVVVVERGEAGVASQRGERGESVVVVDPTKHVADVVRQRWRRLQRIETLLIAAAVFFVAFAATFVAAMFIADSSLVP
jgi:hypothetical protein